MFSSKKMEESTCKELHILVIRETQVKTTMRSQSQEGYIKKAAYSVDDVGKLELLHVAGRCVKRYSHCAKQSNNSSNIKHRMTT